jgi:alpha-N-arabinofuranosidase
MTYNPKFNTMIKPNLKISYLLFTVFFLLSSQLALAQQKDTLIINADQGTTTISKYIYGQFAEDLGHGLYGGVWVGPNSDIPNYDGIRKDVVQALRKIDVPDVRWPGGCFADTYHWKDGIGPRNKRPKRVDLWGNVVHNNAFGTNEFLRFCKLIGAKPYIAGNMGSGSPHEMRQWIEYLTYPGKSTLADMRRKDGHPKPYHIKFWGVGNESWGCGGSMTPEYYSDLYKRYTTFLPNYGGNHLFKIASGPNGADYHWTRVLMQDIGQRMNGLSMHYYTIAGANWGHKGPSTNFSEKLYFNGLKKALRMNQIITHQSAIMDAYDPGKHVALVVDEWGIWTAPLSGSNPAFLHQQNSLRDALIASSTLDIFNKHAARVRMANIAQMVNVLQAMLLTKGKKMVKTPTYYVFKMYKVHQGATYLPMNIHSAKYSFNGDSIPAISATASRDSTGKIHVTLSNLNPHKTQDVTVNLRGSHVHKISNGTILTADHFDAVNTFNDPDNVVPKPFHGATLNGSEITIKMPSKSIVALELQ